MRKTVLPFLLIACMCPSCSASQYTESPSKSRALSAQPSEASGFEPASTFAPVPAEEIPKYADPLTGLQTDEVTANCRPVAVSIDNHHQALPQSGIGQADIYYEVLAEGNITRIIAIFHDFNAQKIGPVRSARPYFLDFAMDYDAILVHHGGSPQAYDLIEETGVADLDAMRLPDTFWRDPERVSIPGMSVHSSYTGEGLIRQAQEQFEFRPVVREGLNPGFSFYEEPTLPAEANAAAFISIPFAADYGSAFSYRDGLYYKSMEDKPQIDAETGAQLSVTNVLIQYAPMRIIQGDSAGRREVDLIGEGSGLMMTKGGFLAVQWNKESPATPTRWYNTDGSDLYFNKGKTWICVVSPETAVSIE